MSWFPDMGTVTMIDAGDHVRAVGWLSAARPYAKGDVPTRFVDRPREFTTKWGESIGNKILMFCFAQVQICSLINQEYIESLLRPALAKF
jgi:hypothetical protein